jgi:hypothetical protein
MKINFIFLFLFAPLLEAAPFIEEAKFLSDDLKKSLMLQLSQKIAKDGLVKSIPFCHDQAQSIALSAAKERIQKYSFGRTSHKIRNQKNIPQQWIEKYLEEFQGKILGEIKKEYILHLFSDGKRGYLAPLYVQTQCLACHGDQVSNSVKVELLKLYPNDQATGFKLNEFRGFVWIKER